MTNTQGVEKVEELNETGELGDLVAGFEVRSLLNNKLVLVSGS